MVPVQARQVTVAVAVGRGDVAIRSDVQAQQVVEHIARGVFRLRPEEIAQDGKLVTARDQRALVFIIVTNLAVTDVREQAVAEAFATFGVLDRSAALYVSLDRFCGTAIAESAAFLFIRRAQVTKVAASLAALGPRVHALDLDDLERIARGRRAWIGAHREDPLHNAATH